MAKFKPGNKMGRGRPKGAKNTRTEQWQKFSDYMMIQGLQRFEEELNKLEGKQYVDTVVSLMEFFQPKLSRTELTGEDGKSLFEPIEIITKK
jgi:ribosomal protein L19E